MPCVSREALDEHHRGGHPPFENPFKLARGQLRRVGEIFGVDPNLVNVLAECKKTVEVSVPVSMDDGATTVFQGFRVVHNVTRGPAKGGIRYHRG